MGNAHPAFFCLTPRSYFLKGIAQLMHCIVLIKRVTFTIELLLLFVFERTNLRLLA
jgi:hypothetical protein